ncbi:MAG: alkaline phosphatase family protein [Pirellulales bacterium]|nr:alkaline phosphatase family protein [Pirellulales bacterium]
MANARVGRVVVLGLDGLDPDLTDQYLHAGLLPNLAKMRKEGSYRRLGTTYPPLSPVAWSSFTTGTNPGKHNIFDFLSRNPSTYGPAVTSVKIGPPRRILSLGPYRIPLGRPEIRGLRKSKPFWCVLGESGIHSTILRVPITFPCDRFSGLQLAAMCVPDLLGTQGTFTLYTEQASSNAPTQDEERSGKRIQVQRQNGLIQSHLEGPANSIRKNGETLRLPFSIKAGPKKTATLRIGSERVLLTEGQYSDWVRFAFTMAPCLKLHGICRFFLKQMNPSFEMYCTPLQIDPAKPAMPISHPRVYSTYLACHQGPFATLGLAEDTAALSEGVLEEEVFLADVYQIHNERKAMFFDAIDHVRHGLVVCVFDAPDRIQHMFWRFMDPDHPACKIQDGPHSETIRDMYVAMDRLVGETIEKIGDETALIVMSDHGFKPFRCGVDLNRWLLENGYLYLKNGATFSDLAYFGDVDWQKTQAYALGLAGIFINEKGREAHGIISPGPEKEQLVTKLANALTGLVDHKQNEIAIREAVPRDKVYTGPYIANAPDIIIGYGVGYRVSWQSAVGKTGECVFSENTKAWSGDHCIHPDLVPGILFTNWELNGDPARIIDLAPTVLDLLGLDPPAYMDGKSLIELE